MSKITGQPMEALPMPPYGAASHPPQPAGVRMKGLDIADTCDGVEQDAFEAWATSEKFEMHQHPMHYIFMDPKTDAARMGWKAGILHARTRILSALEPQQEEAEWSALNKQSLETALGLVGDVIEGPEPDEALEHLQDLLQATLLNAHPTPVQKEDAEPFGWWVTDNASEGYMTFERDDHTRRTRMNMLRGDWSEMPLYRATPVQESQTVSEANEALMRERANMITTHREQIERLTNMLDGYGKLDAEYAIAERRAETLSAKLKLAEAALEKIDADLKSSVDVHEFNSRHMIAEDSLQDAWKMLDMAREQFQVDANSLRIPLAAARSALHSIRED